MAHWWETATVERRWDCLKQLVHKKDIKSNEERYKDAINT